MWAPLPLEPSFIPSPCTLWSFLFVFPLRDPCQSLSSYAVSPLSQCVSNPHFLLMNYTCEPDLDWALYKRQETEQRGDSQQPTYHGRWHEFDDDDYDKLHKTDSCSVHLQILFLIFSCYLILRITLRQLFTNVCTSTALSLSLSMSLGYIVRQFSQSVLKKSMSGFWSLYFLLLILHQDAWMLPWPWLF